MWGGELVIWGQLEGPRHAPGARVRSLRDFCPVTIPRPLALRRIARSQASWGKRPERATSRFPSRRKSAPSRRVGSRLGGKVCFRWHQMRLIRYSLVEFAWPRNFSVNSGYSGISSLLSIPSGIYSSAARSKPPWRPSFPTVVFAPQSQQPNTISTSIDRNAAAVGTHGAHKPTSPDWPLRAHH